MGLLWISEGVVPHATPAAKGRVESVILSHLTHEPTINISKRVAVDVVGGSCAVKDIGKA
jgi:hypothetical protein